MTRNVLVFVKSVRIPQYTSKTKQYYSLSTVQNAIFVHSYVFSPEVRQIVYVKTRWSGISRVLPLFCQQM